jgi:membrane dipeptidase
MTMLKRTLGILIMLLALISCEQDLNKKLDEIHAEIVSIDTHTDTPFNFLEPNFDIGKWNDFDETGSRVDFPRMKAGKLDAVFMGVFIGQ